MKRRTMLLFLIIISIVICAMEEISSNSFPSLRLYLSTWFTVELPSPIQIAQENRRKFEEQLYVTKWSSGYMLPMVYELFDVSQIRDNPTDFLRYCYNQELCKCFDIAIKLDSLDDSLLNACKEARIDGYSALGSAIIAKNNTMFDYKCSVVHRLMHKGFMLTQKDRELIKLEIYDAIPTAKKEIMIFLLHNHQDSYFSLLLQDIKKHIINYIVNDIAYLSEDKEIEWLYSLLQ